MNSKWTPRLAMLAAFGAGGAVVAAVLLLIAPHASLAQAPSAAVPRLAGTEHPNLTGVWQALNEANWNLLGGEARASRVLHPGVPSGMPVPGAAEVALGTTAGVPGSLGVVVGGAIPYKPEAAAKQKENAINTLNRDPEVKCLLPGVPRATYLPYPFQITQSDKKVMIVHGFSYAGRTIHLDEVDDPGLDTWMGHSVGRWEGDTLVVDVKNLNDATWLDRAGNFQGAGSRVQERYTLISPNHIDYEATIENPAVFTSPWKIRMPLYRRMEPHPRVFEYRCIEMTEELVYGHLRKQQLVKTWEGDYGRRGGTLIVNITRKPTTIEE